MNFLNIVINRGGGLGRRSVHGQNGKKSQIPISQVKPKEKKGRKGQK
jgi:hypothetical protein